LSCSFSSSLSSAFIETKTKDTDARLPTGLLIGAPWINSFEKKGFQLERDKERRTDNFRTRKLFVGSPRTKLMASIRFDLPTR
jgi:hypothetical protein